MKRLGILLPALIAIAGCSQTLPDPQPSIDVVQSMRQGNSPPMQVGSFSDDPKVSPRVVIRSVALTSPYDGSLGKYLQKTLEADLRAAGKLDAGSTLVLQGVLTESGADADIATGDASLAADFTLLKNGSKAFEKKIRVSAKWDSSFIGAVAIPAAINQYSSLYQNLANALMTNADFRAALHGNAAQAAP